MPTTSPDEWTKTDFTKREYTIKQIETTKQKQPVTVKMIYGEGAPIELQLREPGIIAFIAPTDNDDLIIRIVEPGAGRYSDFGTPDGEPIDNRITDEQAEQLGIK
jgi:hypothetical protein